MNEDKLLIITRLKKTYEYTLKSLENYPHKFLELKQNINRTMLEMIELCYIANNGYDKKKIQNFENFYSCNIIKIKEILMRKDYVPGKYNLFLIHEPKMRIIMSQQIEDKVINHLIAKYFLIDVFDKSLSNRNCATRIGKGTHYALKIFKQDYNYFLNK